MKPEPRGWLRWIVHFLYPGEYTLTEQEETKVAPWVTVAVILFFILWGHFKHHDVPTDHDTISSQAWSFGEPGE